jgi:hypothetical protein
MRWRWLMWIHVPCAVLGAVLALGGWLWPFAGLEGWLRTQATAHGYSVNLVERYLPTWLHPASLPRSLELGIGLLVLAVNLYIYRRVFRQPRPKPASGGAHG